MYVGEHVDSRICRVCGDTLTLVVDDGCWLCNHGVERGMLVTDDELGVWVHQHCLDFFGVDNCLQFERQYFDI